jgi:hypothetical protein
MLGPDSCSRNDRAELLRRHDFGPHSLREDVVEALVMEYSTRIHDFPAATESSSLFVEPRPPECPGSIAIPDRSYTWLELWFGQSRSRVQNRLWHNISPQAQTTPLQSRRRTLDIPGTLCISISQTLLGLTAP